METQNGLICAYVFDREKGGRELNWNGVRSWASEDGPIWIHFDRKADETKRWVQNESGLDPLLCEALVAEETRPRLNVIDDGVLLILRGVNLNPGSEPDDMVSVRMWVESNRVISLRGPKVAAIEDMQDRLTRKSGPIDVGDFVTQLSRKLTDRMGIVLEDLDEEIDSLEETILEEQNSALRSKLADLRRTAITLRRYVAPQREVLSRLQNAPVSWLNERHRASLRETTDRIIRYVEDLDAMRERAAVTQDELISRLSEQMNKTMYVLSLVAAIFLPLGFVTGLLGVNVGGIPGTENHWAFTILCLLIVGMAVLQIWLFRRKRFF